MDIERAAVNEINRILEYCDHLLPDIDVNDRTALTDGHISLYGDTSDNHSKDNFLGRVDVQVKGQKSGDPSKLPSYPVKRVDLEGYLKMTGVLFFVVAIRSRDKKKQAYYSILSPFTIANILTEMKPSQKQKSLPFRKLSSTPENIERIVDLAIKRRREDPQLGFETVPQENVRGVTFYTTNELDLSAPTILKRGELDFLVEIEAKDGSRLPIDADIELIPHTYLTQQQERGIESGDFKIVEYQRHRTGPGTVENRLTDGITLTLDQEDGKFRYSLTYTASDKLDQRLFDLGFITHWLDSQELKIDGEVVPLPITWPEDRKKLDDELGFFRKVEQLFNALRIDPQLISIENVTDKQWEQLEMLYANMIEGEELTQQFTKAGRVLQPVGPWFIELIAQAGEIADHWQYHGLTDLEAGVFALREPEEEGGRFLAVTPYELIDSTRLHLTLNLRPDTIVEQYERIKEHENTYSMANRCVLQLITAADLQPERRTELLRMAQSLNNWLLGNDGDKPIHLVNQWQITAREKDLSNDELKSIRQLRRRIQRGESDLLGEISCSILLQDRPEAGDLYEELEDDQRSELQEWPIWNLWNMSSTSSGGPSL